MTEFGFDPEYIRRCLRSNKHNHATTTYFLTLKSCSSSHDLLRDKITNEKLAKLIKKSKKLDRKEQITNHKDSILRDSISQTIPDSHRIVNPPSSTKN